MDADAWNGRFPAEVAAALIEHGHGEEVRRHADAGDWSCARVLAEALVARGEPDAAIEVLRPFADAGRWAAVDALASVLDARDRTEEALALVRRHAAAGGRHTGPRLAELLARLGRTGEIVAMLGPYANDPYYARALVRLTAGGGHDDELVALLRAQLGATGWVPPHAESLLATVLERQGRVDEAVALLGADDVGQLAGILARHGREVQLRDLVAGGGGPPAAVQLAGWLEERGRAADAVEVLRRFEADAWELADLLARHGRTDEALAAVGTMTGHDVDLHLLRNEMLVRCGRSGQAIAELRERPDTRTWHVAARLADLLAGAGRPQEAAAVLDAVDRTGLTTTELAILLIRQGRAAQAADLFPPGEPADPVKDDLDAAFWRRFRGGGQPAARPASHSR